MYDHSPQYHHSSPKSERSYSPHSYSQHNPPHNPLPHWSKTNAKIARYDSTCQICGDLIPIGARIAYQFQFRRFVHERCYRNPVEGNHYAPFQHPNPPQEFTSLEDPLAPGSPLDKLSASYRAEAVRWVQFHEGHKSIPGIHQEFSTAGIERYLRHRSRTNKNIAAIESKIKKMGQICGFVLCNSKYQQPSLQYQQLRSAKADIRRERREAGLDRETNEALATGNFAVTMLLAGFDVRSMERMRDLHPVHRELVTVHTMQLNGCMRFGIFEYTDVIRGDIVFTEYDRSLNMFTAWRKSRKSNRRFGLKFPLNPPRNHPAKFKIPGPRGYTYASTGKVLQWYLEATDLELARPHTLLFPHLARFANRRATYSRWLQKMYSLILPLSPEICKKIRPHSARAGWATDRSRQEAPTHTIMQEGRWDDDRAMVKYIRTNVRDLCTSNKFRLLPKAFRKNYPIPKNF